MLDVKLIIIFWGGGLRGGCEVNYFLGEAAWCGDINLILRCFDERLIIFWNLKINLRQY